MAARTAQPVDGATLLHTGQVSVACAGFADPGGNPWLVMNDNPGAVNALQISNASAGGTVTLTVGGANADTNASMTIVGAGTGAVNIGSSVSPVHLTGAPSISSNLTVTGLVTTQSGAAGSSVIGKAFLMGTASGPTIQVGSSVPTSSGTPGSLFINVGGASTAILYTAIANAGTASSSNWAPVTQGA